MRAIHRYQRAASNGDREAQRRIAQSLGYKHSIHDHPHMIALLQRAGIEIETHRNIEQPTTVENNPHTVPVETIQL